MAEAMAFVGGTMTVKRSPETLHDAAEGEASGPAVGSDAAEPVAEAQGADEGADEGAPDVEVVAELGSEDAGGEDFDGHDDGAAKEEHEAKQHSTSPVRRKRDAAQGPEQEERSPQRHRDTEKRQG